MLSITRRVVRNDLPTACAGTIHKKDGERQVSVQRQPENVRLDDLFPEQN